MTKSHKKNDDEVNRAGVDLLDSLIFEAVCAPCVECF